MFSIDEKVVCIKSFTLDEYDIEDGVKCPIVKNMYTIRHIEISEGELFFRFYEIINPIIEYKEGNVEAVFSSAKFRKLDYDFAENIISEIMETKNIIN